MCSLTMYLAVLTLGSNFSSTAMAKPIPAVHYTQAAQPAFSMPGSPTPSLEPLDLDISSDGLSYSPLPTALQVEAMEPGRDTVSSITPEYVADLEQRFVDLINHERMSRGLRALRVDSSVANIARQHSLEMCEKDYFSHLSPTKGLTTPLDRYLSGIDHRPEWALVGENLFYCSMIDVNRGHSCLMDSVDHRDNILNSRYEKVGVGIYVLPTTGEFWVTQLFLASID